MSKIIEETKTEKLNQMLNDNNNSIQIKNKIAEELFFRLNGWRLTEIINWVAATKFGSKIKNYKEKIKWPIENY